MAGEDHFEVVEFGPDEWRWRLQSANGRIDAISGQAFGSKGDGLRAIGDVQGTFEHALRVPVKIVTAEEQERESG